MNIIHYYLACFTAFISLSLDIGSSNIHDSLTVDSVDATVISSPTSTSLVLSPPDKIVADNTYIIRKKKALHCVPVNSFHIKIRIPIAFECYR
jgi:hypothetical protein